MSRVIVPLLRLLRMHGRLSEDRQSVMQAVAMCCPLLTMNLPDRNRFKPNVALLALAMAVELGGCEENPVGPGWFERQLKEATRL